MAKFNVTDKRRTGAISPIVTERVPTAQTHEGAPAYARGAKGELFLLAVANMVGESTFYEKAGDRDGRYEQLIRQATAEDPQWAADLLRWLRGPEANMRSASLVGAAVFAHERLARGEQGMSRQVVDSVLQRADEPGEMLAYWTGQFGRAVPKPVKRGVADAVRRLYSERSLAKYDTDSKGYRFGDVIDLVHPTATADWQGALFEHALDRRHNRDNPIPEALSVLRARLALLNLPVSERRAVLAEPDRLTEAGITWEALAGWLQGPMDAAAWQAVIPSMGYMALLRNLRNFDAAGVPDKVAETVAGRLADPEAVARSRQFPFRFLSAYLAAPSQRWGHALDKALTASIQNIPTFPGRTLVLVDTSASMTQAQMSARSQVTPAWAAALFGVALAARGNDVDLHGFADRTFRHDLRLGGSVLRQTQTFLARTGEVGHGTQLRRHRVINLWPAHQAGRLRGAGLWAVSSPRSARVRAYGQPARSSILVRAAVSTSPGAHVWNATTLLLSDRQNAMALLSSSPSVELLSVRNAYFVALCSVQVVSHVAGDPGPPGQPPAVPRPAPGSSGPRSRTCACRRRWRRRASGTVLRPA